MSLHKHTPIEASTAQKDHLLPQISSLPYFRGLLRAVEARFYENIELPSPTFDLGCGDGHFASLAFNRKLEVGLDPWEKPLQEAKARGVYATTVLSPASAIPYPNETFASAVSNSVLEHIPELDPVLQELNRVMRPGAPFIFCVPNHRFLATLSIGKWLDRLHLRALGDSYRRFFNHISRHHHCDDATVWQTRLLNAGFEIVDWWDYFSPRSLRILEWGHYFGVPSLVSHALFRKWILVPHQWNLFFTNIITRPAYNEPAIQKEGVYTFYIARKMNRGK